MANFCLVPELADKFKKDILEGKIDPIKLAQMTSAERHAFFAKELGESNATPVNTLFESKLLLKNQQQGIINWARKVIKNEKVQRDIISRVQRMDKVLSPKEESAFLEELAEQRLGTRVSYSEAQKIAELTKKMQEAKAAISEDSPLRSKERMEYGTSVTLLKDYLDELKIEGRKMSIRDYLSKPQEIIYSLAGTAKSIVASLDNSFFGRQGIKTLYTNPDIWAKNFAKSWVDIGRELKGMDAILPIKADIYSRPNALNGKYQAGGYGLDVLSEEAFPSSFPEKIPLLGRLFKASESAYNGAALRIRADLADRIIKKAEKQGVNTLDKIEAKAIGDLISSLTGRGNIGKAEVGARELNVLFFSIKFLKSNWDTLTMHSLGMGIPKGPARTFVRKQAALNLLKIIGSIAAILAIANALWPDSVEEDPRSSDFGKIKVGNTRFDITGGMGSLVALASRITPTRHNGEWGFWTKSTTTGEYNKLNAKDKDGKPKFGGATALDVIEQFWEGKLSPLAGVARDVYKGEVFGGDPVTLKSLSKNVGVPISIQTFQELMNTPGAAPVIAAMILDGLGFSTNTYAPKPSKEAKPKFKY